MNGVTKRQPKQARKDNINLVKAIHKKEEQKTIIHPQPEEQKIHKKPTNFVNKL